MSAGRKEGGEETVSVVSKKKKMTPCNSGRSYISHCIRALVEMKRGLDHWLFPRARSLRGPLIMHLKSSFVTLWLTKIL